MSTVIGHVSCQVCGLDADVKESTSGALSILCKNPRCRIQTFIKSPSAVTAMKAKLAATPAPAAAPKPAPAPAGTGKKVKDFFNV